VQVCEGDEVTVKVINKMHAESTSVHWHGQHMRNTPYMDGTPFVTQCPILPGNSFEYKFVAYPHGTHFWHSHVGKLLSERPIPPLVHP
jgi:L-ascorbate oxidase